jgi:membrane protein DedA with SNARE-associated domain
MPLGRVLAFSVAGVGVWSTALIALGYAFAHAVESHLDVAANIGLGLAGAALLVWALRRRSRAPAPQPAAA